MAAVPTRYADLAPDKKKRVEGQAKNIARVLDDLHEEGEEGHEEAHAIRNSTKNHEGSGGCLKVSS